MDYLIKIGIKKIESKTLRKTHYNASNQHHHDNLNEFF